jgi:FecR protein
METNLTREGFMPLLRIFVSAVALFALAGHVGAEEPIGKVVAIRGKAIIERENVRLTARVNTGIRANDIIRTAEDCRVKLLFTDESVLTVGEKSRLLVKEYIYSKEKGGRSIYNLLEGKLHSVVGRTKFEVQTPTAVAAARGTVIYFEVGNADTLLSVPPPPYLSPGNKAEQPPSSILLREKESSDGGGQSGTVPKK